MDVLKKIKGEGAVHLFHEIQLKILNHWNLIRMFIKWETFSWGESL